ncbi:MAG: hypothetical protein GY711_34865 [bacterium]|nr:hypothetical protein [bacterium]
MTSTAQSIEPRTPLRLLRGGVRAPSPATERIELRALAALVVASAVFKLALAAWVTGFVLVDDAYIHLRYARNLALHGEFVYNAGEAVFGLTSPAYGLFTAVLVALFGTGVEQAVVACNVVFWSIAAVLLFRSLSADLRLPLVAAFLFAPNLVDNQLLGMETPLFVMLLVGAMGAAHRGRLRSSAAWYGLALITRPEAVLLAPWLVCLAVLARGGREALRALLHPASLALLLGPGLAWTGYALETYGSVVPQSMVAKTGWNNDHYEALFTVRSVLWTLPRLTLFPYVDYLPGAPGVGITAALWCALVWVVVRNVQRGDATSRTWLAFYVTYVAFYIVGKGATEASWYAVPSTVAFLVAAGPALPGWLVPRHSLQKVYGPALCALALAVPSWWVARERAPLLASYIDGYGAAATALNELARDDSRQRARRVVVGEIGVYGYRSDHTIIDVGALVSPEVLPWKNAGLSFTGIVQAARADAFVISQRALDYDDYPSVGRVWINDHERAWFDAHCTRVFRHEDKLTFLVHE